MTLGAPAFRVLIVDESNTERGPIGERMLRRALADRAVGAELIRVTSAGLNARDGDTLSERAREHIEQRGANANGFAARSASEAVVMQADMIVCPTKVERDSLVTRFPRVARRAFTVSEIAHVYREVAAIAPLHEHPAMLHQRLARSPAPPLHELARGARGGWGLDGLAPQIEGATSWIADTWASALPPQAQSVSSAELGTRIALEVFGVRVAVDCSGARATELAQAIRRVWSRCMTSPDGEPEVRIEVMSDPDEGARASARARRAIAFPDIESALHHLSSAATVGAIDLRRGTLLMLHAAALATPEGDVVGFVAPSGTGKTTLARSLGAHLGYVTDETLALAGTRVLAYPKPLSIVTDSRHGIKEQWGPDPLDLMPVGPRLRLARLVLLDRRPDGPEVPELSRMDHLEGLAELAAQVSYLPDLPRRLHSLSDVVDEVGGIFRLSYREAATVPAAMDQVMRGEA